MGFFKFACSKELDKLKKNNPQNLALEEAELVAEKVLPVALQQYPRVQGAMIALEPRTGDVVAMVGGYEFSYDGDQFNRATQAKRQPGSALSLLFIPPLWMLGLQQAP